MKKRKVRRAKSFEPNQEFEKKFRQLLSEECDRIVFEVKETKRVGYLSPQAITTGTIAGILAAIILWLATAFFENIEEAQIERAEISENIR